MIKKRPFWTFFNFHKNCPYDSNEILYSYSTTYLGLYVQGHQIRMTGIWASQKEKDLSRLFYRTCGSGFFFHHVCQ